MRGLVRAAALLSAPALAKASLPAFDLGKSVPSSVIALEVPGEQHPLTLRLDVQESAQVCGHANVKINGQFLTQELTGSTATGHGTITVEDDVVVDASWIFTCVEADTVPVEQMMSFIIQAIDGEVVEDVSFSASFRQVAPVTISNVKGAVYVYMPEVAESERGGDYEKAAFEEDDELKASIHELELLHKQARELEDLIREKEIAILERFGEGHFRPPPPPPPFSLADCDSIRCVVRELAHKVKHTAGRLCGGFFGGRGHGHGHGHRYGHGYGHGHGGKGWRGPHGGDDFFPWRHGLRGPKHGNHTRPPHDGRPPFCIPYPPPPHGPPDHDHPPPPPLHHHPHGPPPPSLDARPPPPPGGPDHHHEDFDFVHPPPMDDEAEAPMPPPPPPPPSEHHRPDHGRPHHHPPPPPPPFHDLITILGVAAIAFGLLSLLGIGYVHRIIKPTRRHARRSIFDRFFFHHHNDDDDDDEEKQAMLQRRRSSSSCRSEDSTTMEDEIAQLRQAANIVEDMVTAEDGRSRTEMAQHATPPPPPQMMVPMHQNVVYPRYSFSDEVLPAYEDDSHDSSVVTDGCRYTPRSSDYTPSDSGSNVNNVLGDTKD